MAAAVETEPFFRVTERQRLFQRGGNFSVNVNEPRADVAEDGRFIMVALQPTTSTGGNDLILVQNWFTEVLERLGGR